MRIRPSRRPTLVEKARRAQPGSRIGACLFGAAVPVLVLAGVALGAEVAPVASADKPLCGHVCVQQCCELLGIPVEMAKIVERMPPSEQGISMLQMKEALEWIGLTAEGRMGSTDDLRTAGSPVIVHFQDHFVVVSEALGTNLVLIDMAGDQRTVGTDDLAQRWDGRFLAVMPPAAGAFLPAFVDPPGKGEPRIRFSRLRHDLGIVQTPAEPLEVAIPFMNAGSGPLKVTGVRSDCRCVAVAGYEEVLWPGREAEIILRYDPPQGSGPFQHALFVESNDPAFGVVRLTIVGNLLATVRLSATRLDFGDVTQGTSVERVIYVTDAGDVPPVATDLVSIHPALSLTSRLPLEADFALQGPVGCGSATRFARCRLAIVAVLDTGSLPLGEFAAKASARILRHGSRDFEIPCRARVVHEMQAQPGVLFLGELRPGVRAAAKAHLRLRDAGAFRVDAVHSDVEDLVTGWSDRGSGQVEIHCHYTPEKVRAAALNGQVVVDYTRGSGKRGSLAVPVYGYCPSGG